MIFKRLKILRLGLVLSMITQLWAGCPLSIKNASISPLPMEYKGVGTIVFTVAETEGKAIPLKDEFDEETCRFVVDLNKIVPKHYDLSLITGEINTYFKLSYNDVYNQVHFIQTKDIPSDTEVEIVIPVDVTGQSSEIYPFNGFITNIHANTAYAYQYTSTKKSVLLAVSDKNTTIDSDDSLVVAIKNITINDRLNGKKVVLNEDISITSISNNTPLIISKITGKVTVPLLTKGETYTESYTICEIYDSKNCAEANITVIVESKTNPIAITTMDESESSTSITADNRPIINGICKVNMPVVIAIDGIEISPEVSCEDNGTFSFTPDKKIIDGDYRLTAAQKDSDETYISKYKELTIDSTN